MSEAGFKGFPARSEVTPLPNIFYTEVLPHIENLAEVKAVLQVFFLLSRRKGYPRFVSFSELNNDPVIIKGLRNLAPVTDDLLKRALELAVHNGILLYIPVDMDGRSEDLYFINNQAEKDTIAKIVQGTLKIPNVSIRQEEKPEVEQPSDIGSLYEQNIGMLTPIIVEELQEAEHRYPAEWIQEAFREALTANVRNWKYIHSILKRWEREGKKDGKSVRDSRKERDPDKYIRGKYGHVVRRK
jgi:DNA replication protein